MKSKTAVGRNMRPFVAIETLYSVTVCAGFLLAPAMAHAQSGSAPVVNTDKGKIRGLYSGDLAEFFGIPYASAPIGKLRWMPTQPHAAWQGVLQTTQFAPICAQITTLGVFAGPVSNNEDCLFLNVYTPILDQSSKLPVFVWIHGGGNFDGEANDYDGSKLARQGKAVVVTFNYRLGLLGWLAQASLDAEGHAFANYGLLDQQAVLQWVQKNARNFGGDPTNVTLGGQSAGSLDTSANVVSPLASGLFERAIFESLLTDSIPLASGERLGDEFAKAAGCETGASPRVAACLRNMTASQIMSLQGTVSASAPYVQDLTSDGTIIPARGIYASYKGGQFNHMPIMSGTVHDEYNFFLAIDEYFSKPRTPPTAAQYDSWATTSFGTDDGRKVLAQYPVSGYQTVQLAWDAAGTDYFVCPQYAINAILSSQVPVYAYEFNDQHIPSYFPKMPGFQTLAYHTGDIQFLFPSWHGGPLGITHKLSSQEMTLSNELVSAWTNFAWTGNPNGLGDSPWPRYVAKRNQPSYYLSETVPTMTLLTDAQFEQEHKCSFWAKLLPL